MTLEHLRDGVTLGPKYSPGHQVQCAHPEKPGITEATVTQPLFIC
eukprot:COSAG01_NODE_73142_length_251_cov_0.644737_1_plen_44_part_10